MVLYSPTRFATSAATAPAPTPPSILTTAIPREHDCSIAARAASPFSPNRYLVDVGPLMTGTFTIPAPTVGIAPSQPATKSMTSAPHFRRPRRGSHTRSTPATHTPGN